MTWLDWRREETTKNLVANFQYRSDVEQVRRSVCHSVKDPNLHEAICRRPPLAGGRRIRAACEGWSILADDYDFLASWCRKEGFKTVVEFGPGDSTFALLDVGCRVVSHEHDIAWLKKVSERFDGEMDLEILHCPEGCLPDAAEARPDLVLVDGPPFREGQKMSRLPPCEWALEVCGCFLLHDSKRGGERATLTEMIRRGMEVIRIATKKGFALVVNPARRPELLPAPYRALQHPWSSRLTGTWLVENIESWQLRIGDRRHPVKMLTTVAANGADLGRLMTELFPHAGSEFHAIGLSDGKPGDEVITSSPEMDSTPASRNSNLLV